MAGDLDLVAAALRADARDVDRFFDVLARKLGEALPDQVDVRRGGLLRCSRISAITVAVGDDRFEARRAGTALDCTRRTVVRGIAVKSRELELDAWIDALSAAIVAEAGRSERARAALEGLLER
jgi:hypothetical protein